MAQDLSELPFFRFFPDNLLSRILSYIAALRDANRETAMEFKYPINGLHLPKQKRRWKTSLSFLAAAGGLVAAVIGISQI